ncbi:hypothetical protein [Xenorhabdus sp. TH1]
MDKQLNTESKVYTAEIELTGFILYGNADLRASGRIYHDVS